MTVMMMAKIRIASVRTIDSGNICIYGWIHTSPKIHFSLIYDDCIEHLLFIPYFSYFSLHIKPQIDYLQLVEEHIYQYRMKYLLNCEKEVG